MAQNKYIPVLDYLRGFAALAVCLYHFSSGNSDLLPDDDIVRSIGSFGYLGVEMFFVISGFVIPYSLHLKDYRLFDCRSFLASRLKRLEPPYFACILLLILLHQLSRMVPGFRGGALEITWQQFFAHIGYLNAILEFGWLNPVFWTLAIEFQYYLFIALAFPLLVHTNSVVRHMTVPAIAFLGIAGLGNSALLTYWLPLFAIGMATFQFYTSQTSFASYAAILLFVFCISYYLIEIEYTIVGTCTALTILVASSRELPRIYSPLAFLGTISYSLYLLHIPIGGRIVKLGNRLPESVLYRYPAIIIALAVSVFCAYLFWRLIEVPSQRWSKASKAEVNSRKKLPNLLELLVVTPSN